MLISLRSDGTAVMLLPSHVYQGSNVANVFVTAPFPNTTVLQVGFTLPNGTTASAPMTYVQDSENNLVVWQYTISSAITNEAGAASVSITATTQTGQVIASQSIPFTIEATTLPVLPDTPSQDEYTLILQYIQQNSANITIIQGQISTIEEDVATANTNASEALSTANQAASAAASNTTGIANIVNGTTTVAKADSANSATNATNATNDGNGNNIENTYATKTELSTGNADTLAAAQNYTNQALANYSIIEIVQTLPETGDTGKIYLVPKADSTSGDLYSEYLWNGTEWELVGTVSATSGTTIKVNGVSQIEVDFTSDPQTQITANSTAISNIVDGTTTVPNATKATQDGNGNVIATTYATVTALGSETSARQSADTTLQNNINAIVNGTTPAGKATADGNGNIFENYYLPISNKVLSSLINTTLSTNNISNFQELASYFNLKIGESTLPLYYATTTDDYSTINNLLSGVGITSGNYNYLVITRQGSTLYKFIVYPNYTTGNIAIQSFFIADNVSAIAINTTNCLKIDPTTLTPSTDNGWSVGASSTQLEDGVYKIYPITSTFVAFVMDLTIADGSGIASISIGDDGSGSSDNSANLVVESMIFENKVLSAAIWVNIGGNFATTLATSYYFKKLS